MWVGEGVIMLEVVILDIFVFRCLKEVIKIYFLFILFVVFVLFYR